MNTKEIMHSSVVAVATADGAPFAQSCTALARTEPRFATCPAPRWACGPEVRAGCWSLTQPQAHGRAVLLSSTGPATRKHAVRLLAYAYASVGAWGKLMTLFESGGVLAFEEGELEKYERMAREIGRSEEAERIASLHSHVA